MQKARLDWQSSACKRLAPLVTVLGVGLLTPPTASINPRGTTSPSRHRRFAMKARSRTVSVVFALAVLAGCAATKVTQQTPMVLPGLARPNRIWVYDFIADPAKIPADSSISANLSAPSTPPTADELETGRQLSA